MQNTQSISWVGVGPTASKDTMLGECDTLYFGGRKKRRNFLTLCNNVCVWVETTVVNQNASTDSQL